MYKRHAYPVLEPYRTGRLPVGDGHELAYEESGNPRGKPVVCLHGGPGARRDPGDRRLFDPEVYRIVSFDQRGCGASTPSGETAHNTTWDLVADLERLREALAIERWQILGASWGSTLALVYAQRHPDRVTELVLRAVFMLRDEELAWFYQSGARMFYPDRWEAFASFVPEAERHDLVGAYHRRLHGPDDEVRLEASRRWCSWELATCTLRPRSDLLALATHPAFALPLARLETHYFVHRGWLEDRPLLSLVDTIRHIPCTIVQGRYDVVCPSRTAWDLHRAWPEASFRIVEGAGHADEALRMALVAATDRYRHPRSPRR